MSLLVRLTLIVLIALVPALGFQVYTESQARRVRQQLVQDEAVRLLRLVAGEQQRIVEGAQQVLTTISGAPAVQDGLPESCQRLLGNLVRQSPRYDHAAVIGLDGHPVCSSGPLDRSLDASNRAYFRRALQTGGFTIGDYVVGRASARPSIHIAAPFTNRDGKIAGVVELGLDIDWLGQQLAGLALPPEAAASVADSNGTIIARTPDGAQFVGRPIPAADRYSLQGDEIRIAPMMSLDGRQRIAAYSPTGADPKGLRIWVGLDREATFAAVSQANRTGLLLIIAGLLLALAVTALLGRRLIRRPLDRLLAVAERWRSGDLTARTGMQADRSEFGGVAIAFDTMAAALEAREHAVVMALESTTDSVMVLDRDWRFTYLNAHARAKLPNHGDLLGQVVWDAFPDIFDTPFSRAFRTAMETGVPAQISGASSMLGGQYEAHAYPSKSGLTLYLRDITAERRAADALAESESRFRLFIDRAPAAIAMFDTQMRYLAASRRFARDFRVGDGLPENLVGRSHYDLFPDLPERWRDIHRLVLAGETLSSEDEPFRRTDGRTDWVRWEMVPWRHADGSIGGALLFSETVTGRRNAEQALRQSEELFRATFEQAAVGMALVGLDGAWLRVNDKLCALTLYPRDELLAVRFQDITHPDDLAADLEQMRALLAGEIAVQRTEKRYLRKDGGIFWVNITASLLRDADGAPERIIVVVEDITPRRQIEAAQKHSEELFRASFEQAAVGMALVGPDGAWLRVNDRLCGITGYSRAELLACRFQDITHPDDLEDDVGQLHALLAGRIATKRIEKRYLRKDGSIGWVYNTASLLHDGAGTAPCIIVVVEDITERKRAETALRESETRLRLAQEAAGIGIWEYDLATSALFWSPEQYRLHGRDPAAGPPTFQQWLDMVEPDDRAAILYAGDEIKAAGRGPRQMEFRIRRGGDGALRWIVSLGRAVADESGRTHRMVGVNLDITERRQAEDELRRATALLRAVGNCSPDPIYAKDTQGRFVFANPALLAVIGKGADEVIGRTDADWHHDRAQAAAVMANDQQVIETGRAEVMEEHFDTAALGPRVFRSAKAPLRMADGSIQGVVAVSSDITQSKQAEAELRRLTTELEARVQEEVAAREAAQARAAHAERLQALGQLAGGIAHDFNNVLQAIAGANALIERRPDDEAAVRRLARLAIDATERGAAITGRLLAFGRRADLRAESLDVPALLTGLREMLARTLGAAIDVQLRLQDALPPLLADKGQLETVLVNLATNSRDAMPEGGRLIILAATETVGADRPGHATGLAPGRYVRLRVIDTGAGMDAATLSRAAEPFFTTKPVGIGTGLGLSMAKGFAEQSGGGLSVESTPGKGTTVTLWLPEAVGGRRPAVPPPRATAAGGGSASMRVLLVDDDDLVRETAAAYLEDAGFAVLVAANGAEAVALLAAGEAVDIVVTDLTMPGMNGIDVIRAAQGQHPRLPAVLLTGYHQEEAMLGRGGSPGGTFSIMRKPVRGDELVRRLRALVTERGQ